MRNFIVNTNESYRPNSWMDMFKECKASAYHHRKDSVCRISKDDYVYLYHTGVGVIAKGVATSDCKSAKCDGVIDGEYYVQIRFFWRIDYGDWKMKAPTAAEINQKMSAQHHFRHTVFEISDMAHVIDCIFEEKGSRTG